MPRPRFSLRTLLLLVLLVASGFGLWWRWEPWVRVAVLIDVRSYTQAAPFCAVQFVNEEVRLVDLATRQLHAAVKIDSYNPGDPILASRRHVLAIGWGGTIKIVDLQTRQQQTLAYYADDNEGVALSPNGKWLLIAQPPTIYDLEAQRAIFRDDRPTAAAQIHEPDEVEAADRLRKASIQAAHQCQSLQELQQRLAPVLRIAFWVRPDGALLASSVDFETVQLWETNTGKLLGSVNISRQYGAFSCIVSRNGQRLCVAAKEQSTIYDAETNQVLATFPCENGDDKIHFCDNAGERWLIVDKMKMVANFHDLRTGARRELKSSNPFAFNGCTLSPDGSRTVYANDWAVVATDTGEILHQLPPADNPFRRAYFVGNYVIVDGSEMSVYENRRDERLIGVLQLPEFWLTLVFTVALLASLRADYRSLRGNPPAPVPAAAKEVA